MLQTQFIGDVQPLFQRRAVIKAERLRVFQKLPHGGDIKALFAQFCELFQNAADPLGKAGGRPKVEQELRDRQALRQREPNQVGIGRAVAHQQQGQIDDVGPKVSFFPPDKEAVVEPHGILPQALHPLAQTEDADIFAVLPVGGDLLHIVDLLHAAGFFLAVAVAPLIDALGRQIADHRRCTDQQAEPAVQPGQQQQIDRKAEQVGENIQQADPERFDRFVVCAPGTFRLGAQVEEVLIQQIRVRGAGPLAGAEIQNVHPDLQFSEEVQIVQIFMQEGQRHQQHSKAADGNEQFSQRCALFQHLHDRRGKQQFRDGPSGRDQRQRQADRKDRPVFSPPRDPQHIGGVLPDVVFWLLILSHFRFPFLLAENILP